MDVNTTCNIKKKIWLHNFKKQSLHKRYRYVMNQGSHYSIRRTPGRRMNYFDNSRDKRRHYWHWCWYFECFEINICYFFISETCFFAWGFKKVVQCENNNQFCQMLRGFFFFCSRIVTSSCLLPFIEFFFSRVKNPKKGISVGNVFWMFFFFLKTKICLQNGKQSTKDKKKLPGKKHGEREK